MDSMKELEKRWYFYRAKESLRSINTFAFMGMMTLASYYTYTQVDVIKNLFNENILVAEAKVEPKKVTVEPIIIAKTVEKPLEERLKSTKVADVVLASKNEGLDDSALHVVSLEPVIPIIDMEKETRKVTSMKRVYKATRHNTTSQRKMVKAKASTYLTASELSTIKHEIKRSNRVASRNTENIKKINLNGSSINYIETMKKKFTRSKNPRDALLLAKAFYEKKEYSQSEKWALTANKIDSSNDESWHMFAKSKLKLGQKNEALKILSSYYKKSHSPKTKALIIKIKTERL